ncbi:hypothetical protein HYPDE_40113 [Hyphomicrobium denitrificans 1NES1]|uniref:DUF2628 domain-containing protein n=1 Tax=Hyphomicrobium denitrificans 1NES1 TaxID=670307 RepID=N0BGX2_9HYPH|nr:DUF2628 domain-containing protein [Hyphomicrobium denitrificans]AGK59691.1 hypothetical protein HYPDE_40113 [Hyphomicrobium denitrificans 1NES1]
MVTYTVHEPPDPGSDRADRGVELEFVKDGFSWLTAICPPIGFLANGLWLFTLAYFVGAAALGWVLSTLKLGPQMTGVVFLIINIYLGFEISTLKRWMLEQTGWQALGVVTGKSIAECERRFFESWLPTQPIIAGEAAGQSGSSVPPVPVRRGSRFWPFGTRR